MPHRHLFVAARRRNSPLRWLILGLALGVSLAVPSISAGADVQPSLRGSGTSAGALMVQLRPGVTDTDAAQAFSNAGATEVGRIDEIGVRIISVSSDTTQALKALRVDPRIAHVEVDSTATASVLPRDPFWDKEWGPRHIRAPEAWNLTTGDRSVVIAVVDTGVDARQPDLRGRVLRGWDFQNNDANPADDDGHGTAVATVAAAAGNDRAGIAGMCWQCQILPVKVLNGQGHGSHSNIAAGIIWAANHGADVMNLSIAGLGSTGVLAGAIAYALRKGVVVVAAAGNEGSSRRTYPAAYPGVISVAATTESDRFYSWSNRGSWVTLAAPGCAYSGRPGARWAWLCGTSLATPVVTGTVALMKSVAPNVGRARIVALLSGSGSGIRTASAHGRLDAGRAVRLVEGLASQAPDPSPSPSPDPPPSPPPPSSIVVWRGTLSADDRWDRTWERLSGTHRFKVRWSGNARLNLYVSDSKGAVVAHEEHNGAFSVQLTLPASDYAVTVSETGSANVSYEVRIE